MDKDEFERIEKSLLSKNHMLTLSLEDSAFERIDQTLKDNNFEHVEELKFASKMKERENIASFFSHLLKFSNLETFSVAMFDLSVEEAVLEQLLSFLKQAKALRSLTFDCNDTSPEELNVTLLKHLAENTTLERLVISNLNHNCKGKVEEIIRKNNSLKSMKVHFLHLELTSLIQMHQMLKENTTLHTFKATCSSLTLFFGQKLQIPSKISLKKLILKHCHLFDESDEFALHDFLRENKSLCSLVIQDTLRDKQLKEVLEGVQGSSSLCSLVLKQVIVKDGSLLGDFLRENKSLTEFEVTSGGSDMYRSIYRAMKLNSTLKSLKLSQTRGESSQLITEMIVCNSNLTEISIRGDVSANGTGEVFEALKSNKSVQVFKISTSLVNRMLDSASIVDCLNSNKVLKELEIVSLDFDQVYLRNLFSALEKNQTITSLRIGNFVGGSDLLNEFSGMISKNKKIKNLSFFLGRVPSVNETPLIEALSSNFSITSLCIGRKKEGRAEEIVQENRLIHKRDQSAKRLLLSLRARKDGNVVSMIPRRLLIYLLSFLDGVKFDRQALFARKRRAEEVKEEEGESKKRRLI